MEPNQNNAPLNTPPVTPMQSMDPQPERKSVGPAIGIIIIISVLILGGLYFWGQKLATSPTYETPSPSSQDVSPFIQGESQVEEVYTQSSSDDVTSIEADLEATQIDTLGSELNQAEGEL